MAEPILHDVLSVTATAESDVFLLTVDITDMEGERYTASYCSRPDDPFGLSPVIRQWLADNDGSYVVAPYAPPTAEELRAVMPSLSSRQLRLGLVGGGFSLSSVTATIDAMPAGSAKEAARIEWEYATTFERSHPLIAPVSAALGMTDAQVDALWTAALAL